MEFADHHTNIAPPVLALPTKMMLGRQDATRWVMTYLDAALLGKSYFDKEIADLGSLVTLKLNDLPVLWVLHYCTIASKLLQKNEQQQHG